MVRGPWRGPAQVSSLNEVERRGVLMSGEGVRWAGRRWQIACRGGVATGCGDRPVVVPAAGP